MPFELSFLNWVSENDELGAALTELGIIINANNEEKSDNETARNDQAITLVLIDLVFNFEILQIKAGIF